MLSGITVVEVGDGIAGSVAAATLASLGATVHKATTDRRPHAEHLPRLGAAGAAITATLDRAKTIVTVERAAEVATTADIVIADQVEGICEVPATSGATVLITPFGMSGPDQHRAGGELVAAAAGGLLGTIEPDGGGRPASAPGFVALRAVGSVAALAALHGLDERRRAGGPVTVDVSAQEAVVFTSALPECAHVLFDCPGRAGSGRYVAPSGAFPCADGFVRIIAVENHQWQGMVAALGSPDWTTGLEDRPARAEHAEVITARVGEWTAAQRKAACSELLQRHGVPATPVNLPGEVVDSPQLAHRGSVEVLDVDGASVSVLGPPWRAELAASGPDRSGGLQGLRVVELTHVLAGPIVGALLGGMGARVVRVEDLDRLDIYRRTGPFASGIAGPERGAYFSVSNFAKASVAARGTELQSATTALLGACDVLIENVGRSRLERLGVDPSALADTGVLTVRVSGFGSDGPLAEYKVYANNVQAYGGLAWMTRDHDGEPARFGSVLADPLSSVIGATVVAAWALGPHPGGGVVDLAMVEVVAGLIAEFVAAASIGEAAEPPAGNDLAPHAPHGAYRLADDRWLAVAVQDDDEWAALREALGAPPALERPEWSTRAGRFADRHALDDALERTLLGLDPSKAAHELIDAGVRAALVARGVDLIADEHLAARGFFPAVPHPDLGSAPIVGLPWRFGPDPLPIAGAPALGSTTVEEALDGFRGR